jgi:hypothetical protein
MQLFCLSSPESLSIWEQLMKDSRKHLIKSREHSMERRKHARYTRPFPAKLEIFTASGKHMLRLFTKNVSSGGVLCDTDKIFSIGSEVKVSMLVESDSAKNNLGARALVKVKGRVARCGPDGMAIRFYKDYAIQKIVDASWHL